MVSEKDREILRRLASSQMEIARGGEMQRLRREWQAHGRFSPGSRPMVTIELDTFEREILSPMQRCQGELSRKLEWRLLAATANHRLFGDDTVVPDYFPVRRSAWFEPFGLPIQVEYAEDLSGDTLGRHFIPQIEDLHADFEKLGRARMGIQRDDGLPDAADELFGDLLPIREIGSSVNLSPMQYIVHIMSMEHLYIFLYDYPEDFHRMMRMLTEDLLTYCDLLERENLLLPTTGEEHLCQGSYCFTDELLKDPARPLRTKDVWGYLDSQETTGISPEMYEEFIFPYYKALAERFGLLSYGCCEAVHPIWDHCVSKLENLRKVSISPWCDEAFMGERLRGRKIVYLRKPSPNLIGIKEHLDEQEVREHFRRTAVAARSCSLEIAQRDVYHIYAGPDKVKRYVELIRETLDEFWHP